MTIRAHLDDQFARQFVGLPQIEKPVGPRCPYCDGTGDVHSIDGEWRGVCTECTPAEATGLVVNEYHMDGLLFSNEDIEINNPDSVGSSHGK